MTLVGAIDLGGSKILGGVFEAPKEAPAGRRRRPTRDGGPFLGRLVARKRIDTRVGDGPEATIARMATLVEELAGEVRPPGRAVAAVGVASPGPLNSRTGVIIHAPNLFWHDVPLARRLSALLGVPVFVDNDANLAALAEWSARASRSQASPVPEKDRLGPDPLLYVTVSTGVGGGIISRGEIFHGFRDAAGEVGHMTVAGTEEASSGEARIGAGESAPLCNCGNRGCLEAVASGTALGRLARARLGEGATAEDVSRRFRSGDPEAIAIVAELARWLGLGLASAAAVLDPEVIVLGGGVTALGPAFLDLVRDAVRARLMPRTWEGNVPPIEPARLGDDAALIGAAAAAWRRGQGPSGVGATGAAGAASGSGVGL